MTTLASLFNQTYSHSSPTTAPQAPAAETLGKGITAEVEQQFLAAAGQRDLKTLRKMIDEFGRQIVRANGVAERNSLFSGAFECHGNALIQSIVGPVFGRDKDPKGLPAIIDLL